MKLLAAGLLVILGAACAFAAPDARFDGSFNTVTSDAVMGGAGTGARQQSLGLTSDHKYATSLDKGQQPPATGNGDNPSGFAQYKSGLIAAGAGGAMAGLLAFGLGFTPVGILGSVLIGAGAGAVMFGGGSKWEKVGGAAAIGAGVGFAAALAMGATPFGWPMLALAAFGAMAGGAAGGLLPWSK